MSRLYKAYYMYNLSIQLVYMFYVYISCQDLYVLCLYFLSRLDKDISAYHEGVSSRHIHSLLHLSLSLSLSLSLYIYIYIYVYTYTYSGTYSSVVRVSAPWGGGPGFNPHHIELSGLEVRPLKVSGGSPVHLRSKHQELVGKTLWVKHIYIYIYIYIHTYTYTYIHI